MESLIFKTRSGNSYLFSPARKETIPIPNYLASEIEDRITKGNSTLYQTLKANGYLDEFRQNFSGHIRPDDVAKAIYNLSQIVFEMTTDCNLRCEYCCYGDGYTTFEHRGKGSLKFSTAKSVIDTFAAITKDRTIETIHKEPFAISFYGGEPLLNFSVLKQIVEYAEKTEIQNRDLRFTMTTNAVLLLKYADFLSEHNFRILVSLDGNRAHDLYRKKIDGTESFDLVYNNLKTIQNKYPKLFSAIHFNCVYTNKSDAKEIIDFFLSEFGKTPQFSVLHETEGSSEGANKIRKMYKPLVIPEKYRLQEDLLLENPIHKRIIEFCIKASDNCYYDEGEMMSDFNSDVLYPSGTCIPFSKRIFVSTNGELHPCEKVNRDHPLGKVMENGHVFIDFKGIADRFNKMLERQINVCQQCYSQQFCTVCLLQANDEKCHKMINKEQLQNALSEVYSYLEENPNIVSALEKNLVIK